MTLPYDYSRCAVTTQNAACPLSEKCARRQDKGREIYQVYTAFDGGFDCDGFIETKGGDT
jgi:hypothetical protein